MQKQTNMLFQNQSFLRGTSSLSASSRSQLRHLLPLLLLVLITGPFAFAQAPSTIIPDLSKFKLTFPLDADGDDYAGVSYNNRNNPLIKAWERDNLVNWTAPGSSSNNSTYRYYFFTSGSEVVFRAHCAGALTSANSYPRCELRETPNGGDNYWSFNDPQELNARFRITRVPNQKREVCVIQIKGRRGTESAEEALRVDYRQDGSQGLHIVVNEDNTINDVMDYSVGNTIVASVEVDNKRITVNLNNVNVSGSRGQYSYSYNTPYNTGYFKAGCYTQSSIWAEKNGVGDESNNAYGEVRFTSLTLGGGSSSTCVATVPSNRRVTNVGNTSATLDWNDVANFDHYKCRYRKVGTSSWTTSGSIRNSSSWGISGLSSNTQYQWQVRSKCANGSASSYTYGPNFTTGSGGSNPVVTMRKRNAMGYALDGNNGGANNRRIYLWNYSSSNVNQQWVEIDRGGGFYSYQKKNTDYCIDGSNGGARRNPVKLYRCQTNNQNQHFKKVSMGSGYYRLQKRNASGYSIDGKGGGSPGQEAHMWTNNNNNYNQHWFFTTVGSSNRAAFTETPNDASAAVTDTGIGSVENADHLSFWPNPSDGDLTVLLPTSTSKLNSSVIISDLLGRTIYQRTDLQAGDSFNISQPISKGSYILRWISEDGQVLQTDKLIRQ